MAIVPIVATGRFRGQLPGDAGLHRFRRILTPVYIPPPALLRLRADLGQALREIRREQACVHLRRGLWQVFVAIAIHWRTNAEAFPSQDTLAAFTGYTSRAVRDYIGELERAGMLRLRRERWPDGGERIYYAPGPVTLAALAAFVDRCPKRLAKTTPPEAPSGRPPEPPSPALPEAASGELRDQDQRTFCCSSDPQENETSPTEEEQPKVTNLDRELARVALAERWRRKRPKVPSPRWFDRADVNLVAMCSAAVEGDREAKRQALGNALDGAFAVSKDVPTSRFIWGTLRHFFDHVDRGRKAREHAQARAQCEAARQNCAPAPSGSPESERADPAQMRADVVRLFGR